MRIIYLCFALLLIGAFLASCNSNTEEITKEDITAQVSAELNKEMVVVDKEMEEVVQDPKEDVDIGEII